MAAQKWHSVNQHIRLIKVLGDKRRPTVLSSHMFVLINNSLTMLIVFLRQQHWQFIHHTGGTLQETRVVHSHGGRSAPWLHPHWKGVPAAVSILYHLKSKEPDAGAFRIVRYVVSTLPGVDKREEC